MATSTVILLSASVHYVKLQSSNESSNIVNSWSGITFLCESWVFLSVGSGSALIAGFPAYTGSGHLYILIGTVACVTVAP